MRPKTGFSPHGIPVSWDLNRICWWKTIFTIILMRPSFLRVSFTIFSFDQLQFLRITSCNPLSHVNLSSWQNHLCFGYFCLHFYQHTLSTFLSTHSIHLHLYLHTLPTFVPTHSVCISAYTLCLHFCLFGCYSPSVVKVFHTIIQHTSRNVQTP